MSSVIESLPNRQEVIDAMLAGVSNRKIAKLAGVSNVTIHNYRHNVLKPALQTASKAHKFSKLADQMALTPQEAGNVAALAQDVIKSGPFWERLEQVWVKIWQAVLDSERAMRIHKTDDGRIVFDGRDFAALNMSLNQAHKNLELFGKASGLFDMGVPSTVQNTIVLVLPAAPQNTSAANNDAPFEVIDVTGEK